MVEHHVNRALLLAVLRETVKYVVAQAVCLNPVEQPAGTNLLPEGNNIFAQQKCV
jgi:hypothetical protein